jgi:abhydrolase domain-containing protein 14
VDGLRIRYWTNSSGASGKALKVDAKPSIVFFHGYSFSIDNWIEIGILDELKNKGYVVYAIDLPSGKASKSDKVEHEKLEEYVPILEKIFAKLGIGKASHSLVLVGPSMGGGFALAYSILHPETVFALVLISPSVGTLNESDFSRLKMPVLLIWGERDPVFPLQKHGKPLKDKFPNSKLIILKDAGHASYIDRPQEFNDLLIDFLDDAL